MPIRAIFSSELVQILCLASSKSNNVSHVMSLWRKRIGTIIGLTELSSEGEVKWCVTAEGTETSNSK